VLEVGSGHESCQFPVGQDRIRKTKSAGPDRRSRRPSSRDALSKEHKVAFILQILSSFSKKFLSLIAPMKKRKNFNAPTLYFA
jgi:hypothetical protein